MKTDFETGIAELKTHSSRRQSAVGYIDFVLMTPNQAGAIIEEIRQADLHLHRLVREILDEAVSYGEYILTKGDMEALAGATGYELPED